MSIAKNIVARLLEDEAEADDFLERYTAGFTQVGGDFGDPWAYGGVWYNYATQQIVHCPGLEGEGIEDKSSWDMKLTPEEEAGLLQRFPVVRETPEDDDDNEWERDQARDELLQQKAEAANAAVSLPVYRFDDDEYIGDWEEYFPEIIAQFGAKGQEMWDSWPRYQQWIAIAEYKGYHEMDSYPDRYTKAELSKYLEIEL